jgi:hypothetical protein
MFREFPAKVVLAIWFGYQVLMSVMDSSTGGGWRIWRMWGDSSSAS